MIWPNWPSETKRIAESASTTNVTRWCSYFLLLYKNLVYSVVSKVFLQKNEYLFFKNSFDIVKNLQTNNITFV